ncbi:GMC family oxidoreductase [Pollutibacter soli]|uniref:GMC family oxidoreductase n=1 Tax=Pollutibacter soli TaxID=3034157 RepID=UPI003013C742
MNSFSYIIIGAGSAGCVLANRLSAGNDYAFYSTSQEHMNGRRLFLPRGKGTGGSSSINAMIYIRGNRQDYDEWSAMGNKGWSYDEVLPFFKKAENQQIIHNKYHGDAGPLPVTGSRYYNHLSNIFIQAGEELGYTRNEDFNGRSQDGFGLFQVTQVNGERCSAARAYLKPVLSRTNLIIENNAEAERIIIENGKAVGVVYHQHGRRQEAKATKEIILCAGAYLSPKILMISGIGHGDELTKHGIPIVKHLPGVGKNLQDHLAIGALFNTSYKATLDGSDKFPAVLKNLFSYLAFKRGPFCSNLAEAGAFVKSSPEQPCPDIQFHFGAAYFVDHGFVQPKGHGYSIGGVVLNPQSKGTVSLASGDYKAAPLIDHNFLNHDDDLRRMIWAYRFAYQLGMTEAFKPYRTGLFLPEKILNDDTGIADFIRSKAEVLYHPTSSCRMGNDEWAVVNHELKVHGVGNLRVVDASVMPNVTRGNTNAPTIMIAEKSAEMIAGGL